MSNHLSNPLATLLISSAVEEKSARDLLVKRAADLRDEAAQLARDLDAYLSAGVSSSTLPWGTKMISERVEKMGEARRALDVAEAKSREAKSLVKELAEDGCLQAIEALGAALMILGR